jgi:SAM-dependent methyltransferase
MIVDRDDASSTGQVGLLLRALLVCPRCRGDLAWAGDFVTCSVREHRYALIDGIPLLLDSPADDDAHDEIDHQAPDHKRRQASWFDRQQVAEFEITRPHGAPALYGWMLSEKFRRAVGPIREDLPGSTAIVVCGGSGMDAEFLVLSGAQVITSDLSIGAARRAADRARRYGLDLLSIVADVEHLPLADRSVDVAYVHDGLHHLERVDPALDEMTRVANRAIVISEPARAVATAVAVKVGLALAREPAGNVVLRLSPADLKATLARRGFAVVAAERYAMFYRHVPGRVFELLSRRPLAAFAKFYWRVANAVAGRFGNKLAVTAVRVDAPRRGAGGRAAEPVVSVRD